MCFFRKMQKVSWTERKTNDEVLENTIGSRIILDKIKQQQVSLFGHIMRKGKIENLVTQN